MYLPATSTFIALASLALSSTSALVIPSQEDSTSSHLVKREPHFFQVREPSSGYTLYSPNPAHSGSSGSFEFKALDGEQSSEFHVKVFLQAESGNREEVRTHSQI